MEALPTVEAVLAELEALGVTLPTGAARLERDVDSASLWEEFCGTMPLVRSVFEVLNVLPSAPSR